MADRAASSDEGVFCHQCENAWSREAHGLQCPRCQSEFVEVVEPNVDPRWIHTDPDSSSSSLHNPLHNHNPWDREAPDPDEGDIEHVEWNGPGGIHFTRTSFRSTSPGMHIGARQNDPFAPIFQSVTQMMEGMASAQRVPPHLRSRSGSNTNSRRNPPFPSTGPMAFPGSRSPPGSFPTSPLQEGPSRQGLGGSRTHTVTTRLWPRDANSAQPQGFPVDDLHGLLGTLLHGLGTMSPPNPSNTNGPPNPFSLIASLLNPANAAHGDAVYSQEALDRIISQLMEQQNGSTAPGPASASAIAALPKKPVEKSMLGSDGKAECSVCMDNVDVGDQVTVLPCSHWFHGDCVGAWLKEHDTCPHCRQGIMPREGGGPDSNPRSPGQPPRNGLQIPPGVGAGVEGSGTRRNPFVVADSSSSPSSPTGTGSSRRRSSSNSDQPSYASSTFSSRRRGNTREGGGGGITGWIGRRLGGGSGGG